MKRAPACLNILIKAVIILLASWWKNRPTCFDILNQHFGVVIILCFPPDRKWMISVLMLEIFLFNRLKTWIKLLRCIRTMSTWDPCWVKMQMSWLQHPHPWCFGSSSLIVRPEFFCKSAWWTRWWETNFTGMCNLVLIVCFLSCWSFRHSVIQPRFKMWPVHAPENMRAKTTDFAGVTSLFNSL